MITAYIDPKSSSALNDAMNNIIATSEKDRREVVNQQARLWAEGAMTMTPPFAGGVVPSGEKGGNTSADKKSGVEAVKRDILRTITPPSDLFGKNIKDKWLEKVVKNREHDKVQGFLKNVKGNPEYNKYTVAQFDPQLHISKRKYGGRFRPPVQHKLVLDEKFVSTYQTEMSKRVGYMKAGWAVSILAFGGKVVKWIKDHVPYAKGSATILENTDTIYKVKIANWTPTISRHASNYNIVTRMRANALVRQFKNYLDTNVAKNLSKQ